LRPEPAPRGERRTARRRRDRRRALRRETFDETMSDAKKMEDTKFSWRSSSGGRGR